jgi:hypothetical protein
MINKLVISHRSFSNNDRTHAVGTPYVIFEVIAALKVSNSLSVQQ